VITLSIAAALALNEVIFLLQRDQNDRPPRTITLVIPAGTAQRVQAGQSDSSIPSEMVFVVGDTLQVKNEDSVSQELGPIWVPPGTTGSMVLGQAANLSYRCSFRPDQYLGLDIRQPTTLGTRFAGLAVGAPALGVVIFIYSLLVFPVHPAANKTAGQGL